MQLRAEKEILTVVASLVATPVQSQTNSKKLSKFCNK